MVSTLARSFLLILVVAAPTGCSEPEQGAHRVVDLASTGLGANEDAGPTGVDPAALGGGEETAAVDEDGAAAPSAGRPVISGKGSIEEDAVGALIEDGRSGLVRCAAREKRKSPESAGEVLLRIVVGGAGRVKSVRLASSDFRGKGLDRCITRQVKRWKFPRPSGGPVVVTVPLFLAPAADAP